MLLDQSHVVLDTVYSLSASKHDLLTATCARANRYAISGDYDLALDTLQQCNPILAGNTLRAINLHSGFRNLICARRAIHRQDWETAEDSLRNLRPLAHTADSDITFETAVLEVHFLLGKGDCEDAMRKIAECVDSPNNAASKSKYRRPLPRRSLSRLLSCHF